MTIATEISWLFILAVPVACIAWTATHEDVLKEPLEFCITQSKTGETLFRRKFFYLFTCEYCFSHYVTILMLIITRYHLLFNDWRGYLISGFSLVWMANVYMGIYNLIRIDLRTAKIEGDITEAAQARMHTVCN